MSNNQQSSLREEILAQKWKDGEYKDAIRYANEFLDEPYADPDDNERTLARQFIRETERMDNAIKEISHFSQTIDKMVEEIEEKKIEYSENMGGDKLASKLKNHRELGFNQFLSLAREIIIKYKNEI